MCFFSPNEWGVETITEYEDLYSQIWALISQDQEIYEPRPRVRKFAQSSSALHFPVHSLPLAEPGCRRIQPSQGKPGQD